MDNNLAEIKKVASEKYDRMLDLSIKITDDFGSARRLDIEQLRSLLVQISVVSFGSVGFAIPIIGSSSELKSPALFIAGLCFLLIPAIGGLWYSALVIENSIKETHKGYKRNRVEIDEAISNQVFLMQNPHKYDEYVEKMRKFAKNLKDNTILLIPQNDKVLYALLFFLTIGMLSVFVSLLPLRGVRSTLREKLIPCIRNNGLDFRFNNKVNN